MGLELSQEALKKITLCFIRQEALPAAIKKLVVAVYFSKKKMGIR